MRNRTMLFGAGFLFICALGLCCVAALVYVFYSAFPANDSKPSVADAVTSTPLIFPTAAPSSSAANDCPDVTAAILQANQGSVYSPDNSSGGGSSASNPDSINLATYQVNGDQISNPSFDKVPNRLKKDQQDVSAQRQAWQFFTTLIPLQDRQMVSEYTVFTDGPGNILAAVEQTDSDPAQWQMEMDVEDLQDKNELAFTVVHEDGHLLTLNSQQVPPDVKVFNDPNNDTLYNREVAACPTYFTGEGCSKPDSYINQFYDRYWTPLISEWQKIDKHSNDSDPTQYYDMLYAFYQKHANQFVDDYATTNPSEDMAETFAYFVYSPKPAGHAIKDQKILSFYDYPELVKARDQILKNTCVVMK